jgi:outer membrane lipoprotein-sorting protein
MKKLIIMTFILTLSVGSLFAENNANIPKLTPAELVKKVETQYQGKTSQGIVRMKIKTKNWTRTLVMENWSEGRDKFLTRIKSPKKEKGTCTLKVDNNIWNYLPKIDRMIKIPSSLMGDSWMGSHLSNDDLVKDNKIDELFDLSITKETATKTTILGIPKPDAAVVWGKIIYEIDMERLIPIKVDYFDEEEILVRTMSFSNVEKLNDRWIPMKFKIVPIEKPNEFTEMTYEKIKFDIKLPKRLFSIKSLRKR